MIMDLINELQSENPSKERLLELITDENVSYIDNDGYTALTVAFKYYGSNHNCDSNILSKILDMDFKKKQVNSYGNYTSLICAFAYYGLNANCDSSIFNKMLDMNYYPEKYAIYSNYRVLNTAFQCYGSNPNYDSRKFLKLSLLLYPSITRSKLIELLDANTSDLNLKKNIMGVYLYNRRRTIINSRISKRVSKGKYDSLSIFN